MDYRWHKYKFVYQLGNSIILFNFLNKAVISINKMDLLKSHFENSFYPFDDILLNESLIKNSFVIPSQLTDKELLTIWFKNFCENVQVFEWLLVLTKQCNFNCGYCFQLGEPNTIKSDYKNWQIIKFWLCSSIQKLKPKYLNVIFFGGEPTLEFEILEDISFSLRKVCLQNGTEWRCEMVSNGYLLNKKKYDTLSNIGLKRIQITLDGPPLIHDSRRPLHSGCQSTFNEILNNIIILSEYKNIECILRINIDLHNYESYTSLLDILCEKNIEKLVLLNIVPTQPSAHKIQWNSLCFTKEESRNKINSCYLEAIKRGFRLYIRSLGAGPCISVTKGGLVIEPNGNISKCHHLAEDPKYVIGNIFNDTSDSIFDYSLPNPFLKCVNCQYVPLCMAGCRYEALRDNSDIKSKSCYMRYKDESIFTSYLSQFINYE